MDELLVTIEEGARRLGISRSAFYLLVGQGTIETVRLGRSRRVPVAALEAFVEGAERQPVGAARNGGGDA